MKLGFIGLGNMGGAILSGVIKKNVINTDDISVSRLHPHKTDSDEFRRIEVFANNKELTQNSDCIVLAIKPNIIAQILDEIKEYLNGKFIISIAAGWSPEQLEKKLPSDTRFICVMPNIPVSVGYGMSIINTSGRFTENDLTLTKAIFESIGKISLASDNLFSKEGSLTGCGPAFVFEFIEALCDAAVLNGIPKNTAVELTANMVIGAAQMVLKTGQHPCVLKDQVCSPGGTTIEGINSLHHGGFHASLIDALNATIRKEANLNKD